MSREQDVRDLWFRRFQAVTRPHATSGTDAACELVCFPHAGGSAGYWRPLALDLAPAVDVWAVQYPGRLDRLRETPVDDLHALADRIAEVLGPPGDRPRALLGHSMGASLAYEVAVRLARLPGGEPQLLVLSGRRGPSAGARRNETWPRNDTELIARVRRLGGTDAAFFDEPDLLDMVLPALRADYHALASYEDTPGPRLSCPVVTLTGDRDHEAPVEDVRAWQDQTTGVFDTHVFTGGHFFLNDHAREVTSLLRNLLDPNAKPFPRCGSLDR